MDHCINIICSWFFRPDFLSLLFKLLFDKVRKLACLVSGSTGKPTNIRPFHLHTSQTPADQKHLPAKKREIPDRPTQNEWIGLLTEEHRENILTKKELFSDIMNHVQVILKKQFQYYTFKNYKQQRTHQCRMTTTTWGNIISNFRGQLHSRHKSTTTENFIGSHQPK